MRRLLALFLFFVLASPASALELTERDQLTPRLSELTFASPSVPGGQTKARVLVPSGYDPAKRYPVLFLLHGALDNYASWTDKGDAEAITKDFGAIVVMPDTGEKAGYVDWWNSGAFGPPAWETYHLGELLPWIDGHYPTNGLRAISGLSMGGYGTMHYAARRPDLFVAAAAFSPAVDLHDRPMRALGELEDAADGYEKTPYGSYVTDEIRFSGHNPLDLAGNLDGLKLVVRTGNGQGGGPGGDTGDPVEMDVYEQAKRFHARLDQLGIEHVWDDYGAGGHTWFYWQRSLRQTLPIFAAAFADPPERPSPFTYRSIDRSFSVYGWRVEVTRPALEFAELRDASRAGFELRGSGDAVVRTAPLFRPKRRMSVRIGDVRRRLRVDSKGRLHVPVAIGPGNPYQEASPQAKATGGTKVHAVRVVIG